MPPFRKSRRSLNRIYGHLAVTHHGLVDQHLPAGALSAVAVLEFKFSIAQLKNADVRLASRAQRADLCAVVKYSRGIRCDHADGSIETYSHSHEFGHHGGQIVNASLYRNDG